MTENSNAHRRKDPATTGPVRIYSLIPYPAMRFRVYSLILATAVSSTWTGRCQAAPQSGAINFSAITQAIDLWFASQSSYQSGDLITRDQVETVLKKLEDAGIHVPDAKSIAERSLANDSFLVRELTTPGGKQFMRKLATKPGAFSHLDRVSTIPNGEKLIRDLTRAKDGDKFIEYLATTKGGRNMGGMMGSVQGGNNLNQPTGRIYTVADFEAALQASLAKKSP
jgi:hypothetical protein